MKGKIKDALKTKYKSLGFSEKAFEAVATHLEGQLTEESEIDTAVEGVEGLLKAFQGDADKRVTDAVNKAKAETKPEKTEKEKEPEKDKGKENEEVPAWAQGLIETNKALITEMNALKAGKTTETRKATLEAKLANTPPALKTKILKDFGRMKFETDEDFDGYLAETEDDIKGFEENGNQGSEKQSTPAPIMGSKGKSGISTDTQSYIDAKKAETEGKASTAGKPIFQS